MATTKRKTPTQARVLDAWRGGYAGLTRIVRDAFGFLVRDEKMRYSRTVSPPEVFFVYRSVDGAVSLSVMSEYACAPWIVVHAAGGTFQLGRLVRALAPEIVKLEPKIDQRSPGAEGTRAYLDYAATFIRRYGRPILDGDPAFFDSLRPRRKKSSPSRPKASPSSTKAGVKGAVRAKSSSRRPR